MVEDDRYHYAVVAVVVRICAWPQCGRTAAQDSPWCTECGPAIRKVAQF